MNTYTVHVERDGRWWLIRVPEINEVSQARRINEVDDTARELVSICTDIPVEDIAVTIASITVPDYGDILAESQLVAKHRTAAREADALAATVTTDYAKKATRAGIPIRDIAYLLDVSQQRVSQLANF